jgi:peroxidase
MATLARSGLLLGSLSLFFFCCCAQQIAGLKENYYATSCQRAEDIVKEQVYNLYEQHGNTAVSWIRLIFHDCIVQSCDASILLDKSGDVESEKQSERNFGMRNFKYIDTIKKAVEAECPGVVSCADIIALAAREGAVMLGGPRIAVKTGRRDSRKSSAAVVDRYTPLHNDSISTLLSAFASAGIDAEGAVALLGAHSVGRTHCVNLVERLYPEVDPSLDPEYAVYLKGRCPTPNPDPNDVVYARNDRVTPMKLDNNYFKILMKHKGLLLIDQRLLSDPRTGPYATKMGQDGNYFFAQFSRALTILSENNPLTGSGGEIRKHCRLVNQP